MSNWRLSFQMALFFLGGALIYLVVQTYASNRWFDLGSWQVVEAIATWLLAGGVAFAFLQVRQARKSTAAQTAVSIFQEFRNPETVEKLRVIYNLPLTFLKDEDFEILSKDKEKDIEYILDRFDVIAVLVQEGIIDKKLAIDAYAGVTAIRCWYKLNQYIKHIRNKRGYFGDNIEAFTRDCIDYFIKEHIQVKFTCNVKDETIDLLQELNKAEIKPKSLKEIKKARK